MLRAVLELLEAFFSLPMFPKRYIHRLNKDKKPINLKSLCEIYFIQIFIYIGYFGISLVETAFQG